MSIKLATPSLSLPDAGIEVNPELFAMLNGSQLAEAAVVPDLTFQNIDDEKKRAMSGNQDEILLPVYAAPTVEDARSTSSVRERAKVGGALVAALSVAGIALALPQMHRTESAVNVEQEAASHPENYAVSEATLAAVAKPSTTLAAGEHCIDETTEVDYRFKLAPAGSNHFGPEPETPFTTPEAAYKDMIEHICDGEDQKADPAKLVALSEYFGTIEHQTTEQRLAMTEQLAQDKKLWEEKAEAFIKKTSEYDISLETLSATYETMYMKDNDGNGIPEIYVSTENMQGKMVLTFIKKDASGNVVEVKRLKLNCEDQPTDIKLPPAPPVTTTSTPETSVPRTSSSTPNSSTTQPSTSTSTSTSSTTSTTFVPAKPTIPSVSTTKPPTTNPPTPSTVTTSTTRPPTTTAPPSTIPGTSTTSTPPTTKPGRQ